jgi:hypothetical protein
MKNACVLLTALTVGLVSAVWLPSQPASGSLATQRSGQAGDRIGDRIVARWRRICRILET